MKHVFFFVLALFALTGDAFAQFGIRNPWDTPVIQQQNPTVIQYDPYGRVIVNQSQDQVFDSAYDPNRHIVDPGSYRNVNYTTYDQWGRQVQVWGVTWTSYGVPHSKLSQRVITNIGGGGGGVIVNQTTVQHRAPRPYTRVYGSSYYTPGGIQINSTTTQHRGRGR